MTLVTMDTTDPVRKIFEYCIIEYALSIFSFIHICYKQGTVRAVNLSGSALPVQFITPWVRWWAWGSCPKTA